MPVYLLGEDDVAFPPPSSATPEGIVAVGGDVSPERLVNAYAHGIFPWPVEGYPLLWFSPDPRFVLRPSEVHVSRSLRKTLRKGRFRVSADEAFSEVIDGCAHVPRPGQDGTWITPELRNGYLRLHQLGLAHSIEAWEATAEGERLAGGLYGVSLGAGFFGESMFATSPDASKVAFATLCQVLEQWNFAFVDCQVHTPHLERFGATDWPRERFLEALRGALEEPTRRGSWTAPFRRALDADRPL